MGAKKGGSLEAAERLVKDVERQLEAKDAELAMLIARKNMLMHSFSIPIFPAGYTPSPPLDPGLFMEFHRDRLAVMPSAKSDEPDHTKCRSWTTSTVGTVPLQQIQSSLESSGPSQEVQSASNGEETVRRVEVPPVSKEEEAGRRVDRSCQKQTPASSFDDTSIESEDASIDSKGIAHREPSPKFETLVTIKGVTPAAGSANAPAQIRSLTSGARAEDVFDWEVLGLSVPGIAASSAGLPGESALSQRSKHRCRLPCNFESIEEYQCSFKDLIIEECNAYLNSSWDLLSRANLGTSEKEADVQGEAVLSRFRSMYLSAVDPFTYFDIEPIHALPIRFDPSELLLLTYDNIKYLAIVVDNPRSLLLRSRAKLPVTRGQCTLQRLRNLVTMKRQYLGLLNFAKISVPLQQQLLDPQKDRLSLISPPGHDCPDEDVELSLHSDIIRSWKQKQKFNNKQLMAIEALLQLKAGFLLVQGPPGTGKTSTIVGMVSAMRLAEPRSRILVCASSNAAIDEIVSRLMSNLLDKAGNSYTPKDGFLVRYGVKESIHNACLPVFLDNICKESMCSNLYDAKRDVLAFACIVCCTISGSGNRIFDEVDNKFDILIIDEAAQALESEMLIALQRVDGRCVMVGDPCQLPAVVLQRPGLAFKRSLFERMQEAGSPVYLVTNQYRMHPHISKFPSKQFYRGCLKDSLQSQALKPIFKDIPPNKVFPRGCNFKLGAYLFLDVAWGVEQGEVDGGHSIANVDEAEVVTHVVHVVATCLRDSIHPDIGVITPYLAQRSIIMGNLSQFGLDEKTCEVNTVDGFQGREKDVIILSCVRAQTDHGLGFVSDKRRLNVALTRAKHSLIIVGHAATLRRESPVWSALIEDVHTRGFYHYLRQGSPKKRKVSRIESAELAPTAGKYSNEHRSSKAPRTRESVPAAAEGTKIEG